MVSPFWTQTQSISPSHECYQSVRFEANKAAEKEKISEEDVVERIKDNIQGSKHLNFVSDFNKSYQKIEMGQIAFRQFYDDSKDLFTLASSQAQKPTALALVTERQNQIEEKVNKVKRGHWQRPPCIKTGQDGSHKDSSGQGDKKYTSKGNCAHVKGSR